MKPDSTAATAETTTTPEGNASRPLFYFACAAFAFAVLLRVLWLDDKPFWRDEAWVARLVSDPMRAAQDARAVPFGFLLLTRLVATCLPFAPLEISFRVVPLLCGIAVVPLLASFVRRLGGSRAMAVATMWLGAGLAPFVYYSRELKSYEIDVLLGVLLPLLGLAGFRSDAPQAWARRALVLALVLTPWFSFGGIFAAGAVLSWAWIAWWPSASRELRRSLLLASLAFTASFALAYFLVLGKQASDPWMHNYWAFVLNGDDRFLLPKSFVLALWNFVSISMNYLFWKAWPLALPLAIVGALAWPARHRAFLAWLFFSCALACSAAAVGERYLIAHGRLLLFAAPPLLLWVVNGCFVLGSRISPRFAVPLGLGLPLALSLYWGTEALRYRTLPYRSNYSHFFRYDTLHDARAAVAAVDRFVGASDRLLLSRRTAYAFQFYSNGRYPNASYCKRECKNFWQMGRRWLRAVDGQAWALIGDEDKNDFRRELDAAGLRHKTRASPSGIRLLQIWRPSASEKAKLSSGASRKRGR